MKLQTCFYLKKIFKSVFNENTNLFLFWKIFDFVFNENTDLFLFQKKCND